MDNSRNQPHSMLFLSISDGFTAQKQRFRRQEAALLASRNGGSLNCFLFLFASKISTTLIISIFRVMPKISVFHNRTTTCRQISAVCMLRTGFLLNLFTMSKGFDLSRSALGNQALKTLMLLENLFQTHVIIYKVLLFIVLYGSPSGLRAKSSLLVFLHCINPCLGHFH